MWTKVPNGTVKPRWLCKIFLAFSYCPVRVVGMNGEQKKWCVWLPEKRFCEVQANHYDLDINGVAFFFSCDRYNENRDKFVVAQFLNVVGVIDSGNNPVIIHQGDD